MESSSFLLCHRQPGFKGSTSLPLPCGVKASKDICVLCFSPGFRTEPASFPVDLWGLDLFAISRADFLHHSSFPWASLSWWNPKQHHFIPTPWEASVLMDNELCGVAIQWCSDLCCEEGPGGSTGVRREFRFRCLPSGRGPRSPLLDCSEQRFWKTSHQCMGLSLRGDQRKELLPLSLSLC